MPLSVEEMERLNALYERLEKTSAKIAAQEEKTGQSHWATQSKLRDTQREILDLEKNIGAEAQKTLAFDRQSESLSESISQKMNKRKKFSENIFGITNRTLQIQGKSVEHVQALVGENEDLAELGSQAIKDQKEIASGYMSTSALADKRKQLEKEIAEDTGEEGKERNKIRMTTLKSVKAQEKSTALAKHYNKSIGKGVAAAKGMLTSWFSIGAAIGFAIKAIQKANEVSGSVGKEFGALGMKNESFKQGVQGTTVEMMKIGLGAKDLNSSITQLTSEFGMNLNAIDAAGNGIDNMALKIADSGKAMGMNTQEATKLYGTFMQLTGASQAQAENLLEATASLSMAAGVAPQVVMGDIAKNGEIFAASMKDGGTNILEAAIKARQLGLSLDKIAKIGDNLMNFQSSLNAEMEASIMLGKNINLQKAREAYLAGDIGKMQDEVLKQVGSEAKFNAMNVLQRKALAKAIGVSVQDLQKMVSAEEDMLDINGEMIEQSPFEEMMGEETMTKIDHLMAQFESITLKIGEDLLPLIEPMVEGISQFAHWLGEGDNAANVLATAMSALLVPTMASAVSAVFLAMGVSAAAAPLVGWALALAGAASLRSWMKGAMSEAKGMSSAKGSDFMTSGPTNLLVGDNPSGKEHVSVTPVPAPGSSNVAAGVTARINEERRRREQERYEKDQIAYGKRQEVREEKMISLMDAQVRYLRDLTYEA